MTPRPLYRWKTFWFGLLVSFFMTWAWRDSASSSSWVNWHLWEASNAGGGVSIGYKTTLLSGGGATAVKWGRYDLKVIARVISTFAPTSFPSPLLGSGENRAFERSDADDLRRAPLSYRDFLKAMMRTERPEALLLFIPHWLLLSAFVLPWSAFLIWRDRKQRPLTQ